MDNDKDGPLRRYRVSAGGRRFGPAGWPSDGRACQWAEQGVRSFLPAGLSELDLLVERLDDGTWSEVDTPATQPWSGRRLTSGETASEPCWR